MTSTVEWNLIPALMPTMMMDRSIMMHDAASILRTVVFRIHTSNFTSIIKYSASRPTKAVVCICVASENARFSLFGIGSSFERVLFS